MMEISQKMFVQARSIVEDVIPDALIRLDGVIFAA